MYARLLSSDISATKRFGLQGRGYTRRSIDMTPRRWRRRMRVTSSLGASGSLIPSDLRIRLPQVERHDVVQPIELLPEEPRGREFHERRRVRVAVRRRCELYPAS